MVWVRCYSLDEPIHRAYARVGMPEHSVLFDPSDPYCPVCGSGDIEQGESERYKTVWTCNACENWGRQSGYKGQVPI